MYVALVALSMLCVNGLTCHKIKIGANALAEMQRICTRSSFQISQVLQRLATSALSIDLLSVGINTAQSTQHGPITNVADLQVHLILKHAIPALGRNRRMHIPLFMAKLSTHTLQSTRGIGSNVGSTCEQCLHRMYK